MVDPVRQIAIGVASARDEQVARIVALVDGMTNRGQADALITPLRARLQQLRPGRKPRLGRVLFTPLDPVIVPASAWRGERGIVPRTALDPLEALIRAGLGATIAAIEAEMAYVPGPDSRAIARIGARLWKPAADILRRAATEPLPPAWTAAGLPADGFAPACRAIAAVLGAAAEIDAWAARSDVEPAPTGAELRAVMAAALPLGAGACGMLGAVLLARLTHLSANILAAIAPLGQQEAGTARAAVDLALGAALGHLETTIGAEIGAAPLCDAARSVQAAVLLLRGLGRDAGPRQREKLADNRDDLDAQCRTRFADVLTGGLIEPLRTLAGSATPAQATDLENTARDLRRFEQAARQLGGAGAYDAALRRAAEQVRALPGAPGQTLADRVRLVEILAGSEQALSLFALG